jgi:quercetin dioxygenase-like cupin family protein
MLERAGRIRFKNLTPVYQNNLKNREFGKEAAKILECGASDIVLEQGASEDPKFQPQPTKPKTDSSSCFGITGNPQFELFEAELFVAGQGPELHLHRNAEETFYMLEGEMEFQLMDDVFIAKAGEVVHVPKNVPHRWKSHSNYVRWLFMFTPGANMWGYLTEMLGVQEDDPTRRSKILDEIFVKYDQIRVSTARQDTWNS